MPGNRVVSVVILRTPYYGRWSDEIRLAGCPQLRNIPWMRGVRWALLQKSPLSTKPPKLSQGFCTNAVTP